MTLVRYMLILSAIILIILITGCNDARSVPTAGNGLFGAANLSETLCSIGRYIIYGGTAAITLCTLAIVASLFASVTPVGIMGTIFGFLGSLRTILVEAIILAVAATCIGASFIYLGDHLWIIGGVIALALAVLAIHYYPLVVAWWHKDDPTTVVTVAADHTKTGPNDTVIPVSSTATIPKAGV